MQNKEILYGIHAAREALEAGRPVARILLQRDLKSDRLAEVAVMARRAGVSVQYVPKEKLNRLVPQKPHQGCCTLLSAVEYQAIEDILPFLFERGENPRVCILDGVTDVRNAGAIARSAECFGFQALVMGSSSAWLNADAVKASAGALNRLHVSRADNMHRLLKYLAESGLFVLACTEKGDRSIYDLDLNGPLAVVMGSEETGVSQDIIKAADYLAMIPMCGSTSSLNVSVAAGIVFAECCRQGLKAGK